MKHKPRVQCETCGSWLNSEGFLINHRGSYACEKNLREWQLVSQGLELVSRYGTISRLLENLGIPVTRSLTHHVKRGNWAKRPWAPKQALEMVKILRDVLDLWDWQARLKEFWKLPIEQRESALRRYRKTVAVVHAEAAYNGETYGTTKAVLRERAWHALDMAPEEFEEFANETLTLAMLADCPVIYPG